MLPKLRTMNVENQSRGVRKLRRVRKVRQSQALSPPAPEATSASPSGKLETESASQQTARSYVHFFHFDAETGRVNYIDDDKNSFGQVCECLKCGTIIDFEAESCPVCGAKLDEGDSDIVAMIGRDALFWEDGCEIDCPQCGEHVTLTDGVCPICDASMSGLNGSDDRVSPLVSAGNVVFVHLDFESGEVEYLQRLERNRGFERTSLQIKNSGHDESTED